MLLLFVSATLLMVIAVWILGAVGRWWVLVPVMVIDFAATFAVIFVIVRRLGEGVDR